MENNKVALITGCSSGIGAELSRILTAKGYVVVATARAVEAIGDLPAALKLPLNVTRKESAEAAVSEAVSRFQKIDILVNNAGYSIRGALEDLSVESMKGMFDVNVFGIVNMIQAVLPVMRRNQFGKIINIGSISGKFTQAANGAYCASKHAVEALSDAMRLELHRQNIQATVIEPGPIATNFFQTMEARSSGSLGNSASLYSGLYDFDKRFKDKQKLTPVDQAAEAIAVIIGKKHLKPRYEIAVPYAYSMIARFPDVLRESIMKNAR